MYIQVRVEGSAGTPEIGHIAGPSHKPRPNLCAHFREGEERGGDDWVEYLREVDRNKEEDKEREKRLRGDGKRWRGGDRTELCWVREDDENIVGHSGGK